MNLKEKAIDKLRERGVTIEDIAEIVIDIQKSYDEALTKEETMNVIDSVLSKREVINAILTGIAIDEGVEQNKFDESLKKIVMEDQGLYGIDEILALSIVNVFGSIALTNFGYIDKAKPGIVGKIDKEGKEQKKCNTFLDDIVCAIAASTISRIAHSKKDV